VILLDTNVFIYLANGTVPAAVLGEDHIGYASITKIEALGYAQITVAEHSFLEELLAECEQLDLSKNVLQRAIKLRQMAKISLGDSIVAATALEHDLPLWTANTRDFAQVEGLKTVNPINR
jgi:predicted nucleic acid-binding protein